MNSKIETILKNQKTEEKIEKYVLFIIWPFLILFTLPLLIFTPLIRKTLK